MIKQIVYAIVAIVVLIIGLFAFGFAYSGVKKIFRFGEERLEVSSRDSINQALEEIATKIKSCGSSEKGECICEFNIPKFPEGYSLVLYTGERSLSFELFYEKKKINRTILNITLNTSCMFACKFDSETNKYIFEKVEAPKGIEIILDKENVEAKLEGFDKPILFLNLKGLFFKKEEDEFCLVLGICQKVSGPSFLRVTNIVPMPLELKENMESLPAC